MGKVLAGDSESYQYLVESIERFPSQPEFAQLLVHIFYPFSQTDGVEYVTLVSRRVKCGRAREELGQITRVVSQLHGLVSKHNSTDTRISVKQLSLFPS